jgi:hypothetical protein
MGQLVESAWSWAVSGHFGPDVDCPTICSPAVLWPPGSGPPLAIRVCLITVLEKLCSAERAQAQRWTSRCFESFRADVERGLTGHNAAAGAASDRGLALHSTGLASFGAFDPASSVSPVGGDIAQPAFLSVTTGQPVFDPLRCHDSTYPLMQVVGLDLLSTPLQLRTLQSPHPEHLDKEPTGSL